jgi:hypothetical protein
MSTPYSPFVKKAVHTREQVLEVFGPGADGRVAARLHRENRPLYDQLRSDAVAYHILDASRMPSPVAYTKDYQAPNTKRYTDRELYLRSIYSEQELKRFFSSGKEANDLYISDRDEYERRRECGVSFGMFDPRPVPYVKPTPAPEPELIGISAQLAKENNLPEGARVTPEQWDELVLRKAQRDVEAREKALANRGKDLQ